MKNNQKTLLSIFLTFVMIVSCLAIPSNSMRAEAASKLKVTYEKSLAVNCTTMIKTNKKSTFQSSNKKIATVSSKGVVKGKKAGKVKITVTAKSNKKQKKTVTITVKNQLVVKAPAKAKAILYVGEKVTIKTNLSSTFKSSKTSVATVSKSGKVTAKKTGKAKITVTAKKYKKLKKTVTITVKEKTEPTTEAATSEEKTTEKATSEQTTTEKETTEELPTEKPTDLEETTEELVWDNDKYTLTCDEATNKRLHNLCEDGVVESDEITLWIERDYDYMVLEEDIEILNHTKFLDYLGLITATDAEGNDISDKIKIDVFGLKKDLTQISDSVGANIYIYVEDEKGNIAVSTIFIDTMPLNIISSWGTYGFVTFSNSPYVIVRKREIPTDYSKFDIKTVTYDGYTYNVTRDERFSYVLGSSGATSDKITITVDNDYEVLKFDKSDSRLATSEYLKFLGNIKATDENGNDISDKIVIDDIALNNVNSPVFGPGIVVIYVEDDEGNSLTKEFEVNCFYPIDDSCSEDYFGEEYKMISDSPKAYGKLQK